MASFLADTLIDGIALLVFFVGWVSYTFVSKWFAYRKNSLSSVMHQFRIHWVDRLLGRGNRIADMTAVSNLERNSAFFASSSLFVLAGLMTVLAASDQVRQLFDNLDVLDAGAGRLFELKISLLIGIFIYAFLSFTWSMRQYGFVSVMLGAAFVPEESPAPAIRLRFVEQTARVIDLAARQFNYGLRAVYFSLAALGWLFGPWGLIVATIIIVLVLQRREFRSGTLHALTQANQAMTDAAKASSLDPSDH
jgi:uncharacterized membrane protein